ncbi:MAG: cache domain-containing protein [Planctomycetota bacterium]
MSNPISPAPAVDDHSPEHIARLAESLMDGLGDALKQIGKVNEETRMLSFNAAIEAARAGGSSGKAFGIVAEAIRGLSDRTADVAGTMSQQTGSVTRELRESLDALAKDVRGIRLTDLALTHIDLIDRNLFERSCDVRWWATDASLVDALGPGTPGGGSSGAEADPDKLAFASKRLGVILSAYTIYHDLVLADATGRIIANGKPHKYTSQGQSVVDRPWFRDAMASSSGEDYAFETLHESPLIEQERTLAYSCAVRTGGEAHGRPLGVLGILFDWDSLAQTIVNDPSLTEDEKQRSRCCIVDDDGLVLADSEGRMLKEKLPLPNLPSVLTKENHHFTTTLDQKPTVIAHAYAPGYETYTTGWHSLIIQTLA